MGTKILHIPYGDTPAKPSEPIACRNNWEGNDGPERAFFSAAWNEKALTVSFLTQAAPIVCRHLEEQGAVSDDSCVEVFLRPKGSAEYYNIEFNIACYINAARRLNRHVKTPLAHEECDAIKRTASPAVAGPVSYEEDGDWSLTLSIPWEVLGVQPARGLRMEGNFYACAGDAPHPYFLSWAPIESERPDFHRPEFFGDIVLD